MKKLLLTALLLLGISGASFASEEVWDINAAYTADNYLGIWLSTDPNTLGTWLHNSNQSDSPYDWLSPEVGVMNLTPNVTNYLHIQVWGDGQVAGGLIGSMDLNNSNFRFANGLSSLTTTTTPGYWTVRNWDDKTGIGTSLLTMLDKGQNGAEPWGSIAHGAFSEIDSTARWIWTNEDGTGDLWAHRIFTTPITPVTTPEPISAGLFLLGGGALAILRRKKA